MPLRWDIFCRIVDHFGDAGVCWRLARQLATEHAQQVRLWIDEPGTLTRLVPGALPGELVDGVRILRWPDDGRAEAAPADGGEVADVVIGAFQCEPPAAYRDAMRVRRPLWIELEYLSAESWVASCHGLPSPKPDGLVEHFFFPGFDSGTGGLLRERGLQAERAAFGAARSRRWLATLGVVAEADERLASLFCYPTAPVGDLIVALSGRSERWRLLVPEGVADATLAAALGAAPALGRPQRRDRLTVQRVPFVPQHEYDRLLWSCELNLVRGEDSFVRAIWAGRPFLWQAYVQADDAHLDKLHAFATRYVAGAEPALAGSILAGLEAWNGARGDAAAALAAFIERLPRIEAHHRRWCETLPATDLASALVQFAVDRVK